MGKWENSYLLFLFFFFFVIIYLCISWLLTSNKHDTDGEDLFRVGVWGYVSKTNAGQTAEGEVQSRHVLVFNGGSGTWHGDM